MAARWIEACRKRCETATEGPWSVVGEEDLPDINDLMIVADELAPDDFVANIGWYDAARDLPNACFIAAARSDLPRALALLDVYEAALRAVPVDAPRWHEQHCTDHVFELGGCTCFQAQLTAALEKGREG